MPELSIHEATGSENDRPVLFVHDYMMGNELWRQVSRTA